MCYVYVTATSISFKAFIFRTSGVRENWFLVSQEDYRYSLVHTSLLIAVFKYVVQTTF
jgi:hypothetical protein